MTQIHSFSIDQIREIYGRILINCTITYDTSWKFTRKLKQNHQRQNGLNITSFQMRYLPTSCGKNVLVFRSFENESELNICSSPTKISSFPAIFFLENTKKGYHDKDY